MISKIVDKIRSWIEIKDILSFLISIIIDSWLVVEEHYYLATMVFVLIIIGISTYIKTSLIIRKWLAAEESDAHALLNNSKIYRKLMPYLLRKIVRNDAQNEAKRSKALYALAYFTSDRTTSFVIEMLKDHNQPTPIRKCAAAVLGNIASIKAIKPLCEALKDFQEPGVAQAAANALKRFSHREVFRVLKDCLNIYAGNYKGDHFVLTNILQTIDQITIEHKEVQFIEPLKNILLAYEHSDTLNRTADIIIQINTPRAREALEAVIDKGRFSEDREDGQKYSEVLRRISEGVERLR